MSADLHLGVGHDGGAFALPREALLHVWSVLAVRGAGKTYTAKVVVEEVLERHLMPVVVIDPMDAWWGLKSSADGQSGGYPVVVMGGKHADVPLEPTAGRVVADFFVERRPNMILALGNGERRWPKSQAVRFVGDFSAQLYERNAGHLMLLAVDEQDIFANQQPDADQLRCLGMMVEVAKRGRTPGIMLLQITQRSSDISKKVLDETEVLVALRTTSPRDQDALESWFRHVPKEQQDRKRILLETWSKLPNGTAWFWWPEADLFQQVRVRTARTFDSSATPKFGEKPKVPKVLAPVDLKALEAAMAATIERADRDNPAKLQARIADLERQLRRAERAVDGAVVEAPAPLVTPEEAAAARKAIGEFAPTVRGRFETGIRKVIEAALADVDALAANLTEAVAPALRQPDGAAASKTAGMSVRGTAGVPLRYVEERDGDFADTPSRLLRALARFESLGLREVRKGYVAALAGRSPTSSTTTKGFRALRDDGLVEYPSDGLVAMTPVGRDRAPDPGRHALEPADLIEAWRRAVLDDYDRALFDALIGAFPKALARADLAERTGKSATSSTFVKSLRKMRDFGIVEYGGVGVRASERLFLAAGAAR